MFCHILSDPFCPRHGDVTLVISSSSLLPPYFDSFIDRLAFRLPAITESSHSLTVFASGVRIKRGPKPVNDPQLLGNLLLVHAR